MMQYQKCKNFSCHKRAKKKQMENVIVRLDELAHHLITACQAPEAEELGLEG